MLNLIFSIAKARTRPNTNRKYSNFDKDKFINEISFNLPKQSLQELTLEAFPSMFKTVCEKQTPLKKKYVRANHSKFVTK